MSPYTIRAPTTPNGVGRLVNTSTQEIAVLIGGFGAGWSSWYRENQAPNQETFEKGREILLFDPEIVQAVLDGNKEEAERIANRKVPRNPYFAREAVDKLEVVWLDEGDEFIVHDCEGEEELWFKEEVEWSKA